MENLMQIILLAIIGLIIKLLGKIYFPKTKRGFNQIRKFFKGTDPIKPSKQERRELQMKYLRVLLQTFFYFVVGITGHHTFSANPELLNSFWYLIFESASFLLILFSLLKFIQGILLREKFENTGFWW